MKAPDGAQIGPDLFIIGEDIEIKPEVVERYRAIMEKGVRPFLDGRFAVVTKEWKK